MFLRIYLQEQFMGFRSLNRLQLNIFLIDNQEMVFIYRHVYYIYKLLLLVGGYDVHPDKVTRLIVVLKKLLFSSLLTNVQNQFLLLLLEFTILSMFTLFQVKRMAKSPSCLDIRLAKSVVLYQYNLKPSNQAKQKEHFC